MSQSNPVVQLAASSVYVTTNLMLSPGFHWCLYVTDKDGYATRHHWAQGLTGIEQYKSNLIDPVTTYTTNSAVLAYLKIGECLPPDAEKMKEICASVLPGSKLTVKENRQAGITCRTWLLQVLTILEAKGFLVRPNGCEGIEQAVKKISEEQEV
jgi:hypothetical protein